jgi:hypothetical protein
VKPPELLRAERSRGDQRAEKPGHQHGAVGEEQPSRVAQELAQRGIEARRSAPDSGGGRGSEDGSVGESRLWPAAARARQSRRPAQR